MAVLLERQRQNSDMFRVPPQMAPKLLCLRLFGPIRTNVGCHLFVKVGGCLPGRQPPPPHRLDRLDEGLWSSEFLMFHLFLGMAGDQNVVPGELMASSHGSRGVMLY